MKFAAALLLLGVLAGCAQAPHTQSAAPQHETLPAATAIIDKTPLPVYHEASGTVRPRVSSTLQSQAMGALLAVHAHEGLAVKKGDLLAEVDAREIAARVDQAKNAQHEAQQARQQAERAVQAALHARDSAEAQRDLAKATHGRTQRLLEKQATSPQTFDEATAALKQAEAAASRAAAEASAARIQVNEADARIAQAKAALDAASAQLSHARVLAPFDGIVTRKFAEVGDLAGPGVPLFEMETPEQYRLESMVSESDLPHVTVGGAVAVTVDALDKKLDGVVSEIVPEANPDSHTVLVKIDLPANPGMKTGMYGRIRFEAGRRETLLIPQQALLRRGQLTGVHVVDETQHARFRLVTLGESVGDTVEILSGLDAGERIVVESPEKIGDGSGIAAQ